MPQSILFRAAIALCLAFVLTACSQQPQPFRSTSLEGVKWGKDFELTAHTGQRLRTVDYRGRVLVLFFGYTHCPDICAPALAKLAQLSKALGEDAKRVQVLFISVDPQHDNPAQLKKFLAGFDPGFIGLTGTLDELGAVAADHMVFFKQAKAGRVEHTGMLFVQDTQGRMRLLMKESTPLDDMLHDLRLLLAS
ncbi:MAG TPA: SCO family protein [Acidiferrobacterales bacterium]|nr:SCO family protein [Acidiferrobacterales bacterium]